MTTPDPFYQRITSYCLIVIVYNLVDARVGGAAGLIQCAALILFAGFWSAVDVWRA